jgi:type II secretion system (T2SS) protein C
MPRKLVIINAILLFIAAGSVTFIVRQLMAPMPMPLASRTRSATAPAGRVEQTPRNQAGAYATVAARNLFSPTRSESPPTAAAAPASAVKPNLFGIILRDGAPMAYLEDPTTKRVAAYHVGDTVAGGTVQTISADSVVIARPDGTVDVRLRDPSKPRPSTGPATAAAPGAPPVAQPVAGPAMLPGVIPPAAGAPGPANPQPGVVPPQPGQAGQPTPPLVPGRRPLPPNLLRRLPQGSQTDAPQP